MGLGEGVTYHAYRAAERVSCLLPEPLVPAVTRAAGAAGALLMPARRRMICRHLGRVYGRDAPERAIRRAAAASFRSYARYWLDTFRLPLLDAAELDRRFDHEGLATLDGVLASGRGAVIGLPHLGSWDQAGAWLASRGYPVTVVMERIRSRRLRDWFVAIRTRIGIDVVVRGPGVWDELERALRSGRVVALLCDRDLGRRGIETEFFGERTTLPRGPALLARRCRVPVLPAAAYTLDDRRRLAVIRPPLPLEWSDDEGADLARATRHLAGELEVLIRRAPEQWHLMQPNWPSDVDAGQRRPAGARREPVERVGGEGRG